MRPRPSAALFAALLAAAAFPATPLAGDEVHLKNGRKFEGVIAEVGATQVTIHMPHGELSLPRERVLKVEKGASPFETFLGKKRALLAATETGAADWLELALWAKTHELSQPARETALIAARLDPWLEGLADLLFSFDYRFDETTGRWLPFDAWMAAQGMVRDGGEWISREELAERRLERREVLEARRARRTREDATAALATALEARAIAAAVREESAARRANVYPPYATPSPAISYPGGFFPLVLVTVDRSTAPPGSLRRGRKPSKSGSTTPRRELILRRDFGGKLVIQGPGHGHEGPPGRIQTRHPQP